MQISCVFKIRSAVMLHFWVVIVWNQNEIIVNDTCTYIVATGIMLSKDIELCFVDK